MNTFRLKIITPSGIRFDNDVEELYLKTADGYIGILAHHDLLITNVEEGKGFIKIKDQKQYYNFQTGIMNITKSYTKLIISDLSEIH